MSAFNVVSVEQTCPSCQNRVSVRIQFKYGDTWQNEYRLGDRIRWGGNDTGAPGRRRVVLDGAGERCPKCGYSDWDFYVFLQDDVLSSVKVASGEFDFVSTGGEPIILQE
jgi:hypothetical protein